MGSSAHHNIDVTFSSLQMLNLNGGISVEKQCTTTQKKTSRRRSQVAYAVFVEFLGRHKMPFERFVIYSQLSLKWKPDVKEDRRLEIPDLGVGNFTAVGVMPPFKLRFGVEAKRAIEEMKGLLTSTQFNHQ